MKKDNNKVLEEQNENALQNVKEDEVTKDTNVDNIKEESKESEKQEFTATIEINGKPVKTKVKKEKKSKKNRSNIMVEYRKPSFFTCILLMFIGALIATIVLLSLYVAKTINSANENVSIYKDEPVVETPQKEEENKVDLDLSFSGEFVTSLYAKIPLQVRGYEAYMGEKVTRDSLDLNNKTLFVLREMEKANDYETLEATQELKQKMYYYSSVMNADTIEKFDYEKANELYKKIYGSDQKLEKIQLQTNLGYVYEYHEDGNCYYRHDTASDGQVDYKDAREMYKVEANDTGTEVYIYDYYICYDVVAKGSDFLSGIFFKALQNTTYGDGSYAPTDKKVTDSLLLKDEEEGIMYEHLMYKNVGQYLDLYKDNGAGRFIHTFKLDEKGNYYWYSSSLVDY